MSFTSSGTQSNDEILHLVCGQISFDYQKFIQDRVLPRLKLLGDLTYRDLLTLLLVSGKNGKIAPGEIAQELRLNPSTISRAVHSLQTANMVRAEANDLDTRSIFLHLTENGQALVDEYHVNMEGAVKAMEDKYGLELTQAEWDLFIKVLYRLRARAGQFGKIAASRTKLFF